MDQLQRELFDTFTAPLIGLPITHAWRGIGSAIFFEFGELSPRPRMNGTPGEPQGTFGLMIEWSWRIEGRRSILCGSWSDEAHWTRAMHCLTHSSVTAATPFGRLPEISLALSSGMHVVSLMTGAGNPAWCLFDRREGGGRWLLVRHGRLRVEEEPRDPTGRPRAASAGGTCHPPTRSGRA